MYMKPESKNNKTPNTTDALIQEMVTQIICLIPVCIRKVLKSLHFFHVTFYITAL